MSQLNLRNCWHGGLWGKRTLAVQGLGFDVTWHGWAVPGLVNAHAHAFQRAMAGLAEHRIGGGDSFWSWRETMYAFAERFDPDLLQAVAAQSYVEMLEAGYTRVCEFHYLHHAPDGRPYAPASAMADALIAAASEVGIGLTLLPALYMQGGFDGRPLAPRQYRFAHTVDSYLALIERLRAQQSQGLIVGVALHSLRAVPASALRAVLESGLVSRGPVHIHIAEQTGEVDDCLAFNRQRPISWLLDHAAVDHRWCLVHATHMDDAEIHRLARSGAVVALCPTTEANLGDGLFPLQAYLNAGGRIAIGSDSNISISPIEELRWLDYGQRLRRQLRNPVATEAEPHSGERLFALAFDGGRQAAGLQRDAEESFFELDGAHPLLSGSGPEEVLDRWIYAGNAALLRGTCSALALCVQDGRHVMREVIAERYRKALARLRD